MSFFLPRPRYALITVLGLCALSMSISAQQSDEPAPAIGAPVEPVDSNADESDKPVPAIGVPVEPADSNTDPSSQSSSDTAQPSPLSPDMQQALLAYTQGLAELNKGSYQKAIELLSFAISKKPNDAQFHYMAAKAYEGAGEFRGEWFHLRKAVRLRLNHEEAVQDFMRMWQTAVDKNVLDVGTPQETVKAALGEPDAAQTEASTIWQYGFMGVEFYEDQVAAVLDLRGSGNLSPPLEKLEITLDDSREWKIKQQFASRSEHKLVYAPIGASVSAESGPAEILTHNRLIGLKQRMTVQELMEKMKAGLSYEFPEVQWNLLQSGEDNVVFEWWLTNEGLPKQHEIVRLMGGKEDIHRLAYTVKTAPLEGEAHEQWVNRLQKAKLTALTN